VYLPGIFPVARFDAGFASLAVNGGLNLFNSVGNGAFNLAAFVSQPLDAISGELITLETAFPPSAIGVAPLLALGQISRGIRATATVNRVVVNGARGQLAEARVLDSLGLTKNTTAVSTAEGRAIPDALNSQFSVEIKDTINVTLTRQLRIQTDAARRTPGQTSVLVTGDKTCVSGPCSKAFDQIVRRPDLGPQ
jgi:hypothetical protein